MIEKDFRISVLDNGYVKYVDHMGSDEEIIESARMSTGRGFEGWEKDEKLLDFLWRNKHTSPFEMCDLVIEVQAPIFVFREWHRHRTQSYNEFSARYSMMTDLHYVPHPNRLKKQSTTNKQGSDQEGFDEEEGEEILTVLAEEQVEIFANYKSMIDRGLAKEIARINTPVSRYSKMRAKANLLNWFRFLDLRMRPNAQYEISTYAYAVASIIEQIFPRSYNLFEEYNLNGVHFGRTEMMAIRNTLETIRLTKEEVFSLFEENAKSIGIHDRKLSEFMKKLQDGGSEILG